MIKLAVFGLALSMIVASWTLTIGDIYRKILKVERELLRQEQRR